MFAFAGVTRTRRGSTATTGARVVGTTTGAVSVLGAAPPALFRAARTLTVLGAAASCAFGALGSAAFGATPSTLGARTSFGAGLGLGRARPTRGGVVIASPEASIVRGLGTASSAGTFFPGRDVGPTPSAVTARTVARAVGPATAAFGTPSSFGTHVVLDCLSRPVGLTIPWWKGGCPPGGSVIRDLFTVYRRGSGPAQPGFHRCCLSFKAC